MSRGGSGLSQSFSPGDHKTPALLRLHSAQNTQAVVWEGDGVVGNMPRAADVPLESSFDEGEGKSQERAVCSGLFEYNYNSILM